MLVTDNSSAIYHEGLGNPVDTPVDTSLSIGVNGNLGIGIT